MPAPPSKSARRYDRSRAIFFELLDNTAEKRFSAVKLLLLSLGGKLNLDLEPSLDNGIFTLNQVVVDETFAIDFHIVFPVATLDFPEVNTVHIVNWTVHGQSSIISAAAARKRAFDRIRKAINSLLKPGQPLEGRIRNLGQNPIG